MITILAVTVLLGTAVISGVESCNIGGFKYVPPPPPPCEPCQSHSSGKLGRIFFGGKSKCCDLTEETTTEDTTTEDTTTEDTTTEDTTTEDTTTEDSTTSSTKGI